MVFVTWKYDEDDEVNVESFLTTEDAYEFISENNLSDIADITEMGW